MDGSFSCPTESIDTKEKFKIYRFSTQATVREPESLYEYPKRISYLL